MTAANSLPAATAVIEQTIRNDWGRILALLTKSLGDLQLAEDCFQDAIESAIVHWNRNAVPKSPAAWLIQTARRKAIDRIRRQKNFQTKQAELTHLMELDALDNTRDMNTTGMPVIPDKRLEMIFTCCHPAIEEKSRLALTLRTLGGLTTREIARAFLDKTDAMAARLTRAKRKIATAGIAYEIPSANRLAERLTSVLRVIYLIHNEGYQASAGDDLVRHDLTKEAIRLAETVHQLMPEECEAAGLLCLLLLHQARYPARLNDKGEMTSLQFQDRSLWDRETIEQATRLLKETLTKGRIGSYQLQAAITACHCDAPSWETTDWPQIVSLYRVLEIIQPGPVVTLNRLAAQSHMDEAETLLPELETLEASLAAYQPWHAVRADLLRRAGQREAARAAYESAIRLSDSEPERLFLLKRRESLDLH